MLDGSQTSWAEKAAALQVPTQPVWGGEDRRPTSDDVFATANPYTASDLTEFRSCSSADVDAAVASARGAFDGGWRRMDPIARKEVLLKFAQAVRDNADDLALMNTLEMGKPISLSVAEVLGAADFIQYFAELADKITGELAATDITHTMGLTIPEPRGVIGIITPWNFPTYTVACAVAPALAAGNTVVVKASEVAPSSTLRLAQLALGAGLPAGVFNALVGTGAETGAALAMHMDVDKLHFTGSTAVGRQLMVFSGQSNAKPVMLETGGKSPQIVFADAAKLDGLGAGLASVFANTGQICVARTRLIVEKRVADDVVAQILAATPQSFTAGDTLDPAVSYGPICNKRQFERVQDYIQLSRSEGAVTETAELDAVKDTAAYHVLPTIVCGAQPEMRITKEEVFGPVLTVLTFETEAEAIALANQTDYGLAATAWTTDLARAQRLIHQIDTGRVDIRTRADGGTTLAHLTAEPFGASGHGPLGGTKGLMPYLRQKGVQIIS